MTELLQATDRLMSGINRLMVFLGSLALVAASVILSYSVASRAFFGATTDWQDEAAVFCLVGATFLCGAYVQQIRGHVGISRGEIQALDQHLPHPHGRHRCGFRTS